jgi:hypothetical protein
LCGGLPGRHQRDARYRRGQEGNTASESVATAGFQDLELILLRLTGQLHCQPSLALPFFGHFHYPTASPKP